MENQGRRNFLKAGTAIGASLLATSAFSTASANGTQENTTKK
ncbi:MAG: twin-arginine translocation signal domain-containing protein [Bacteroidia bacterium]|nr:twin-arginine translocation signal domain-containing protein [Bacteroidia bacterium]